jgi:hypothetical protein
MTHPALPGMFHTGMIVKDLDAAMHDMTAAFGFEWAPPITSGGDIRIPGGAHAYRQSRVTYSLEGPHHIELIEHLDNTAWRAATGGPLVHHLGFSVADLAGEVARLRRLGYQQEFSGLADDGSLATMSYFRDHNGGLWIELVDVAVRNDLENWITTGEIPGFAAHD